MILIDCILMSSLSSTRISDSDGQVSQQYSSQITLAIGDVSLQSQSQSVVTASDREDSSSCSSMEGGPFTFESAQSSSSRSFASSDNECTQLRVVPESYFIWRVLNFTLLLVKRNQDMLRILLKEQTFQEFISVYQKHTSSYLTNSSIKDDGIKWDSIYRNIVTPSHAQLIQSTKNSRTIALLTNLLEGFESRYKEQLGQFLQKQSQIDPSIVKKVEDQMLLLRKNKITSVEKHLWSNYSYLSLVNCHTINLTELKQNIGDTFQCALLHSYSKYHFSIISRFALIYHDQSNIEGPIRLINESYNIHTIKCSCLVGHKQLCLKQLNIINDWIQYEYQGETLKYYRVTIERKPQFPTQTNESCMSYQEREEAERMTQKQTKYYLETRTNCCALFLFCLLSHYDRQPIFQDLPDSSFPRYQHKLIQREEIYCSNYPHRAKVTSQCLKCQHIGQISEHLSKFKPQQDIETRKGVEAPRCDEQKRQDNE